MINRLVYILAGITYKFVQSRQNLRLGQPFQKPKAIPLDDDIGMHFIAFGSYEQDIISTLITMLPAGSDNGTFVDAGAHIGTYSVALNNKFNNILSFEPNVEIFKFLRLNTQHFKNVQLYNYALGSKETLEYFSQEEGNTGKSHLTKIKESSSYNVDVKRLDGLIANLDKLKLIKIDVEGFENEILAGARKTILRHKPWILIEVLSSQISHGNSDSLETLQGMGYKEFYSLGRPNSKVENYLKNKFSSKLALVFYAVRIMCLGRPQPSAVKVVPGKLKKRNYEAILCKC